MLAVEAGDLGKLKYPLLASYKMDGIRCLITKDGPRTRSLKPVPNKHISSMLESLPVGLDGELLVRNDKGLIDFRATTSAVMNRKFEPKFEYHVFDLFNKRASFLERSNALVDMKLPRFCLPVTQVPVASKDEVESLFQDALDEGYEGLILRASDAPYKFGRATAASNWMLKVKPWSDAEATIIGMVEAQENTNEARTNPLGRTERSSHADGLRPKGTLGALVVSSPDWPEPFQIGTGFTQEEAADLWRGSTIGKTVRFRYVKVGGYDLPRFPSYQGLRAPEDMS
jgi:DNA ligase-1